MDLPRTQKVKRFLIFLGCLLSIFLVFRWDYYLSRHLFKKVCSDSEMIGLHIYEKDYIDRKHTRPQSMKNGYETIPLDAYYYDGTVELLKSHIDTVFEYKRNERIKISNVGPIVLNQTSIRRISDGKLLSKATIAVNQQGWLARTFSFSYHASYCPPIEAAQIEKLPKAIRSKLHLLRDTLIIM